MTKKLKLIEQIKKNLSEIEWITNKLRNDLWPIQTDFAKYTKNSKQYINSFCSGKRKISTNKLLFLFEQYDLFKTVTIKRSWGKNSDK